MASGRSVRDTLGRRLASGEITSGEYHRLKDELGVAGSKRSFSAPLAGGILALAALLLLAAAVWGMANAGWDMWDHMGSMKGGSDTSGAAVTIGDPDESVEISGFAFSPGNLQVPTGATVTWTNRDAAPHDATSRDGSWGTGRLSKGDADSVTFARPGEYDCYSSIHPSMQARLSVR